MKIKSARALHARLAPRPHYYQSITPAMPARNFAYGSDGSDRNNTVLATMTFTSLKPSYLLQMLLKMQIQGQFWKLLVLRIPKHPQHVKIDKVLTEIFEIKDKLHDSKKFQ